MSVNEEGRQIEIADELAEVARTLVHSTRTVPHPSDSYELLASLRSAQESLAQVYTQLAAGTYGQATALLNMAADSATKTADLVGKAHSANAVVRWFDDVKETV
jgi:hypothetical protein